MKKKLVGDAGQYFVAGELSRRGYAAALTTVNTEHYDLLVINEETHAQAVIQVKTTSGGANKWILSRKVEDISFDDFFYVFVNLHDGGAPTYHIVPSGFLRQHVAEGHAAWLRQPGKNGKAHNDNPMRSFTDFENKWRDRWDLIDEQLLADRRS